MAPTKHSPVFLCNKTAILLRLFSRGECVQSALRDLGHNNTILKRNLATLAEGGLVMRNLDYKPRLRFMCSLTE